MAHLWSNIAITGLLLVASCKHEQPVAGYKSSGYPEEIGKILVDKCAVAGCHNNASYEAAAALNLTTWYQLFKGGNSGSVVIPYRPDYSPMCYFTNTDTSLGVALSPTMPIDQSPLSKQEYLKLASWINDGAPSATGEVMFSGTASRSKFYVANRMCDVVTVFDAELLLQTRYVDVGIRSEKEFPCRVKVAPDKKHWYVSFFASSDIVQKFSCSDDRHVQDIHLGPGRWTSFAITADSRYGFFVDNSSAAHIAYADLEVGKVIAEYSFDGKFSYLSGVALNEVLNRLYVGTEAGNFVYSIDISNRLKPDVTEVPIDGGIEVNRSSPMSPAELLAETGGTRCFISCAGSKEIRIVDMKTDKLVGTVKLNTLPAFMTYDAGNQRLFVTCPDDEEAFAGDRGSIAAININTGVVAATINSGYQPYGIVLDETRGRVVVANANFSTGGPASHHASRCGERNGNVSFIDLATLKPITGKRREVAVFPFSLDIQ